MVDDMGGGIGGRRLEGTMGIGVWSGGVVGGGNGDEKDKCG